MYLNHAYGWMFVSACMVISTSFVKAESPTRDAVSRVEVLLTTAPGLSEQARIAMTGEAAEIWKRQGITVDWLSAIVSRLPASNRLRVLVVQSRPIGNSGRSFAVGELIRTPNSPPVALISIESAQRLVDSLRGRVGYELITLDERRLGIVLGRALAHEIGHFLLDTHTHARTGLMRPQFDALEFTDLREGGFALDHAAAAWLRTREVGKFAYAR